MGTLVGTPTLPPPPASLTGTPCRLGRVRVYARAGDERRPDRGRGAAASPAHPLRKAAQYSLNHWEALTRFIDDARMPLDHNAVESALRVVRLGENNYLFAGSTQAAKRLAAILTVIATARAHRLNAMDYLTHVFTALPELGEDDGVAHLLPAAAKAAGATKWSGRSAPARRPGGEAATTAPTSPPPSETTHPAPDAQYKAGVDAHQQARARTTRRSSGPRFMRSSAGWTRSFADQTRP